MNLRDSAGKGDLWEGIEREKGLGKWGDDIIIKITIKLKDNMKILVT